MIRILHVVGKLNVGGAENYLLNLYRAIDKNVIQFDFLVHGDDKGFYEDEVLSLGAHIYRISHFNPLKQINFNKQFQQILDDNKNRWKVIEIHSEIDVANIAKLCKKNHIRSIAHAHSASYGKGVSGMLRNHYFHKLRKYIDIPFACSQEAAINRYGDEIARRSYFINNAININKFMFNEESGISLRKKYRIDENAIVYGHVGRLHESKNQLFLVDIFKELYLKNNNSYLFLVGDGPLYSKIQDKVQKNELSNNVVFAGNHNNTNKYYSMFDCLIMPSLYEGIPLTMIEAQTNGLTIFASDHIDAKSKLCDLVHFISLDKSAKEWAQEILTTSWNKDRYKYIDQVSKSYDTNKLAKWYTRFIESIGESNDSNGK
jgi:glycosyltransferase involved in cell wall biosynthesis